MDEAVLERAIEAFLSTQGIDNGTSVELWLPIALQPERQPERSADTMLLAGAGTALLVDNEDIVLASTSNILSKLGYAVVETAFRRGSAGADPGMRTQLGPTDHLMLVIILRHVEDDGIAP